MPAGLMARAVGMVPVVVMARAAPIRQDMDPAATTPTVVDPLVVPLNTSDHFDGCTITSTTISQPSRRVEPPISVARVAAPAEFLTQPAMALQVAALQVVPIRRSIITAMAPLEDLRVVRQVVAFPPTEAQDPCSTERTKSPQPTKGQ